MRLLQLEDENGRFVAARAADGKLRRLRDHDSVLSLAQAAANGENSLPTLIEKLQDTPVDENDFFGAAATGTVLPPIDHPEPARMMISGTGLTHLGSAQTRDSMHAAQSATTPQTDSMRMFQLGVAGGKPPADTFFGAQPEWFYKGDGTNVVAPGNEILRPAYASNGGEEPEIAGVYIVNQRGQPCRAGFVLGNEYSDHIMEKKNYLWLAHSKLRQCALGPELFIGELPASVEGISAVRRKGETIWQKPFFSGEKNMCHSIANLERHHFKYDVFCRPGQVHVHFFGTATLSFADGISPEDGDTFIIESEIFGQPLINRLRFQMQAGDRDIKKL